MNGLHIPASICKVEVIHARVEAALNTKINQWLQDNNDCTIVDLKLTSNDEGYVCLIIYRKFHIFEATLLFGES